MAALVQQLPALTGVVIGALGSYPAVVRGDRARFRRERVARREERRFAVYAGWAQALKQQVTPTYRVAAYLGNDPHPHPPSPQDAEPLLAEIRTAREPHGEALVLLGSPKAVEQAREWIVTVLEMERSVRVGTRDPAAWQGLLERRRAGREGYYTSVRDDLGLTPGHSAPAAAARAPA